MRLLVALAALIAAVPTLAQTPDPPSPPLPVAPPTGPALDATLDIGFGWGGDDVFDIYFTNGGDQTITAGQGFVFTAGLRGQPSRRVPVDLRGAVGYKVALTAADDANIRISRLTLEAGPGVVITPDIRAGLVVVHHAGVAFKGDGFVEDIDLGSGTGGAIEASWRGIGLTYTAIRYTDDDGEELGASNIALSYRFLIPIR